MHPAPSLIIFTTLSGLGFGLMVFLGIDPPDKGGWVMAVFAALALALTLGGLAASTLHLGHPERAWRAFSQWRSSWLSREACLAVATLACFTLYAGAIVLADLRLVPLGWLTALLAELTVLSTAMIYAQLRSVPRWHDPATPALFLLYGLAGGALLAGNIGICAWLLALLGAVQLWAWHRGDRALARASSTMETATGLGDPGRVRLLEPPHTGPSYLTREMMFRIGRKHALKLRAIAFVLGIAIPAAIALSGDPKHTAAGIMALSHLAGVLTARWLFFAEAEHVMSLYYGQR